MDINIASEGFAAIGSPQRLSILKVLVRSGEHGLTIGDVQERVGLPASTLSHHMQALVHADLVIQSKSGRSIYNRVKFDNLRALSHFILSECCADEIQIGEAS